MPEIKTGYSKNILAAGKCIVLPTEGKYAIELITEITRPDGTKFWTQGRPHLVNKDEVSNIKEEEI